MFPALVFGVLLFAVATVLFGVALLGLAAGLVLRRKGLALAAAGLLLVTAPFGLFTSAALNGYAWPGRYDPLTATDLIGRYQVDGQTAWIDVQDDGQLVMGGRGWRAPLGTTAWRWIPSADWARAEVTGQLLLGRGERPELVLIAQRDGSLLVERQALVDPGAGHPRLLRRDR